MKITEYQVTEANLKKYEQLSIAFEGDSVFEFEAINGGLGGFKVYEKPVTPFQKNYDEHGVPSEFYSKFDLSNWKLLLIEEDSEIIGGALLAYDTKGINMLANRQDLIVVWDIRINSNYRQQGLGSLLFNRIKEIAKSLNVKELNIETQNNNVKACKFYQKQGAEIKSFKKEAYADLIDEIQIIWSIKL